MSPMSGVGWPLLEALGYLSFVTVQVFDVTVERCISVVQKQATVSKNPLRVRGVSRAAHANHCEGGTCGTNEQTHGSNSTHEKFMHLCMHCACDSECT